MHTAFLLIIVAFDIALCESSSEPRVLVQERINQLNNKTIKILTGNQPQNRPPPPPPHHLQTMNPPAPMPIIQNSYYPTNNYPQNQYPQTADLSGQGSGLEPSFQQPQQQKEGAISDIYVQIIGAIEKLVGRIDKLDSRLSTMEKIVLHLSNKKEQPQQGNHFVGI